MFAILVFIIGIIRGCTASWLLRLRLGLLLQLSVMQGLLVALLLQMDQPLLLIFLRLLLFGWDHWPLLNPVNHTLALFQPRFLRFWQKRDYQILTHNQLQ